MIFILINGVTLYIYQVDGDLLKSVLPIQEEATEAMVKLTCPRSTSRSIWHSMGIEFRSRNSYLTSSTIIQRNHTYQHHTNSCFLIYTMFVLDGFHCMIFYRCFFHVNSARKLLSTLPSDNQHNDQLRKVLLNQARALL